MWTTIFATLALVFLIFDVFQIAEIHSKNKLLNECSELINKQALEIRRLIITGKQ
jgi:hypothetical protein